jgi:hypothetical protein
MAETMDPEARRLLTAFSEKLDRRDPQPLDWQRLYEFILFAFRHSPQSSEAVGHALVQDGLDWDEADQFVLFYAHAMELLEREAATTSIPRGARARSRVASTGRKPGDGKRRPPTRRKKG